jgi:Sulfotransferase domain
VTATQHSAGRLHLLGASSRESAPAAVRAGGRRVAREVGQLTAGVRMLPDFIMVGAQRSGTTSLYRALSAHPNVVRPLFHKGVHYFDMDYARGPAWYRGHFPVSAVARLRRVRVAGPVRTFESSGYYMHHPLAPARMAQMLPDVRLLVMLRDPVERAYSAHRHELNRGFETEGFERALELEPERLAGEVERMVADPAYASVAHRHHSYLDRGLYAGQLKVLFDLFGRDQVLVLDSEAFFATPEPEFARVLDFVGLPPWQPATFGQHNAQPRSPMAADLRSRLDDWYAPHDAELGELLGETPSWRR